MRVKNVSRQVSALAMLCENENDALDDDISISFFIVDQYITRINSKFEMWVLSHLLLVGKSSMSYVQQRASGFSSMMR